MNETPMGSCQFVTENKTVFQEWRVGGATSICPGEAMCILCVCSAGIPE